MANNYVLGRGSLFFDPYITGTETGEGELAFGNAPSFSLNVETQDLEHFSSQTGIREKDESVTLQTDYAGSFTTDNINADNVAMFFFGTASTLTQSASPGLSQTVTVKQGRAYQVGQSISNPSGVREIENVTVTGSGGTPTYVLDTDYTVDLTLGRVTIIAGGGIADDTEIVINYDTTAVSRARIISGRTPLRGALRFLSDNGVGGNADFYMPKVVLRPNGEYQLLGDEWQQIGFNVEILRKSGYEAVYRDGRAFA